MAKRGTRRALAGWMLLIAAGGAQAGEVTWDDPAGNVTPAPNQPAELLLDIVRTEARGAGGALRLTIRVKDDLRRFFGYRRPDGKISGEVVAQFFIDADNSPDSGGHPRWAHEASRPLRGYEFEVMVQLGYRYRREDGSGGFIAGNALLEAAKLSEVQPMATFDVAKLRQGSDSYDFQGLTLPAGWREAAQRASRLDGNTIEVTVPYEWLGLKRGQTIRLCFKDRAIGAASGKGFSADKLLRMD